jgi:pimeloyl-ACP methyl ester carboxylesterase
MKLAFLLCPCLLLYNFSFSQIPTKAEMVTLNGSTIYYEIYGKGEPLFLLHGFTQSSKSWLPFVDNYANDFEVYLVDLKGHGKSSQFTEKLSMKVVARDVDALIRHLNIQHIHAIGFSYGGDVLFQLALLNPPLIKSMISIGACGSWNADDFPEWVEYLSYKNIDNLPWMREQQTSDEQIRSILDQMINYKVYVSDEELKNIYSSVLFVLGDQDDGIPLEYISRARKNLPTSYLWILPNAGHSAHQGKNKTEFVRVSKEFFSGNWASK